MALQGNIDSFSVVDVLSLLGSSNKTGRLDVDGDRGRASVWLDGGQVVGGETARPGAAAAEADPADVVFDLMRFRQGEFAFEADVTCPSPRPALAVAPAIEAASAALEEWSDLVAVVPSTTAQVELVSALAGESITLDDRLWRGVWAVGAAQAARGVATADLVGAELGVGELTTMRLVRDLVRAGVVHVGAEVDVAGPDGATFRSGGYADEPAGAFGDPAFGDSSYGDASFGDSSYADPSYGAGGFNGGFEVPGVDLPAFDAPGFDGPGLGVAGAPGTDEPTSVTTGPAAPLRNSAAESDAVAFDPPAFLAADAAFSGPETGFSGADPAFDPAFGPADDATSALDEPASAPEAPAATQAPSTPAGDTELDSIFGTFDPFGTAARITRPEAGASDPGAAGATDPGAAGAAADDAAAQQADLARQLAMLSPRAAEAVASADPALAPEDDERARVARFLGSV